MLILTRFSSVHVRTSRLVGVRTELTTEFLTGVIAVVVKSWLKTIGIIHEPRLPVMLTNHPIFITNYHNDGRNLSHPHNLPSGSLRIDNHSYRDLAQHGESSNLCLHHVSTRSFKALKGSTVSNQVHDCNHVKMIESVRDIQMEIFGEKE